ncbi:MAG: nucleotide pyrophosphohydrolase [Myxococcales bacterium]|nr:nucleotide pyrophosphohydrolase [Myxococcales bacterium]
MHPFDALRDRLAHFVEARDWAQFHTPKNMAACVSVEAAELLELFMWTREGPGPHPPGAGPPDRAKVEAEVGDVLLCLLNFCAAADIDLLAAAQAKLTATEAKYPVDKARGVALKSTALVDE